MKKILLATAFAALLASPVLAQSSEDQSQAVRTNHTSSHQQVARHGRTEGASVHSDHNNDVYGPNGYRGTDPDPRVRLQLQLESTD